MTEKTKKGAEKMTAKTAKSAKPVKEKVDNPENLPVLIVKHEQDLAALDIIESGIKRDIEISKQIDKGSSMISIKIGLALNSAKEMLRHGEFGPWVDLKFGEAFGTRKSQYCTKIAKVFVKATQGRLELPAPRETGNWLAVQNDGGQLRAVVEEFIGDLTFPELLEKHHIKAVKKVGGWRPSELMTARYVMDNKALVSIPFEDWTSEQKDDFRTWADEHNDGNSAEAQKMAAEASWQSIRSSLEDHGMSRASWKLLSQAQLQDTADVLKDVLADISKALKMLNKSV